ncbi:MAG: monomethylamine:corrinoid methyltransferase [Candidatus Bipolaricaulia bacterium]
MINFLEILRRVREGPRIKEKEYNLKKLYPTCKNLVEKYKIRYDPDSTTFVPNDDEMADAVFEAAIDLLDATGVYHRNTGKLIEFSRTEIERAANNCPTKCHMGIGKEAKAFHPRQPDDSTPPWCHVGNGILSSNEQLAARLITGYGNISNGDSIAIPNIDSIEGLSIQGGTPTEILGSIRAVEIGRRKLQLAGRPGLPIANLVPPGGTSLGTIAASNSEFGVRPSDGWLVEFTAELKVDNSSLSIASYLLNWGGNIGAESGPMVGGYAGGAEAAAILNTAYVIAGRLVLKSNYHLTFPIHIKHSCSTPPEVLWSANISAQAISRNINFPVLYAGYAAAGPTTRMYFYEAAAYTIGVITSGVSAQTILPAKAVKTDYMTPLAAEFCTEVAHASAGIGREKANEVVTELLKKYEDEIKNPPVGKRYQDSHNMESGRPKDWYLEIYSEVIEELNQLGLNISKQSRS